MENLINTIVKKIDKLTKLVKSSNNEFALTFLNDSDPKREEFLNLKITQDINEITLRKLFKLRLAIIDLEIEYFSKNDDSTAYYLSTIYGELLEDVDDCRKEK